MVLEDLQSLGIQGFNLRQTFGNDFVTTMMLAVVVLLMVGIIGIMVYRYMQYKYRVILDEPRGGTLLRGVTEARKVKEKNGSVRWFIKSLKKKVAIPNLEYINPSMEKKLRDGVIELLRVDEETFIAVNVAYELNKAKKDYKIKIVPLANSLNNIRQINSDLTRDYSAENWFKANLGVLVQMAGLMMIIGAVVFIVIMLQDSITASNGAVAAATEVNTKLADTMIKYNACNVGSVV